MRKMACSACRGSGRAQTTQGIRLGMSGVSVSRIKVCATCGGRGHFSGSPLQPIKKQTKPERSKWPTGSR